MQIFAGVPWGWVWSRFSLLSFSVLRIFCIHGHMTAFTWCDCRWPWRYFKAIKLFHIKFLVNGALYGRSYYKVLIGNHALVFDWCHFWWPWSTFEGHFSGDIFYCSGSMQLNHSSFFPSTKTMRQSFSGTAERIFMKLLPNDTSKHGVWN